MEFTAATVQKRTGAKAVMLLVVHPDGTIQNTSRMSPGTEALAVHALKSLADKIEKGEGVRVEMNGPVKN